jgi:uncharacterized lipoprotein YddW (UPF0748 family)
MKTFQNQMAVLYLVLPFFYILNLYSQNYPTKEVRGVWVGTVSQLDWPRGSGATAQKNSLLNIIQSMKEANFNTVVFQVRARGDLMYPSAIEPWAASLTNTKGIIYGTDPGYDPLQYAVDECHKRGMELHAWWNVFNVTIKDTAPVQYAGPTHVSRAHPDWVKSYSGELFLDPGIPEVRTYLVSLVMEMVRKYDIDAVHFDYIRYPSSTYDDAVTYAKYGNGQAKDDWRRENVTKFVREIYDSIMAVKPMMKIGSAVAGIYKSGIPGVGSGWYGYSAVYQNSQGWLQEKKHDYLAPMMYWALDYSTPYPLTLQDWVINNYGRHVYGGVGASVETVYPQISRIVDTSRYFKSEGNFFFRYYYIAQNNFSAIKNNYIYPANIPPMIWKDSIPPNTVKDLKIAKVDNKTYKLSWNMLLKAEDGDLPKYFNIYRSTIPGFNSADARNLYKITVSNTTEFTDIFSSEPLQNYFYAVSALDKGNNESCLSNITSLNSKILPPVLVLPLSNAGGIQESYPFTWNNISGAGSYKLQISPGADFAKPVLDTNISGTTFPCPNLQNFCYYYWRVGSIEEGNIINFSAVQKFRTILAKPILTYPVKNADEITLDPVFLWAKVPGASMYKIQISTESDFSFVLFESTVNSPFFHLPQILKNQKSYYWRVNSANSEGISEWSEILEFNTESFSAPLLSFPDDKSINQQISMIFKWNKAPDISKYNIQISTDSLFAIKIFSDTIFNDTIKIISGLKNNKLYFWRVGSLTLENNIKYSKVWSFKTFDRAPLSFKLLSPVKNDTLNLIFPRKPVTFRWNKSVDPDEGDNVIYSFSLKGNNLDNIVQKIKDTSLTLDLMSVLLTGKSYLWFIESSDGLLYTRSDTNVFFTSINRTGIKEEKNKIHAFSLSQNFPNPFNPVTKICYNIPSRSLISFHVYDVLGKEIFKLADEYKETGEYSISFNGQNLPSGVYFYKLECIGENKENFRDMKKMMLVR